MKPTPEILEIVKYNRMSQFLYVKLQKIIDEINLTIDHINSYEKDLDLRERRYIEREIVFPNPDAMYRVKLNVLSDLCKIIEYKHFNLYQGLVEKQLSEINRNFILAQIKRTKNYIF